MSRRLLVVCTANVCRSPVASGLLQRALGPPSTTDPETWTVSSAGTALVRAVPDANTVAAAAAVGLDLQAHVPRHLDREILHRDGADLVLTMTRAHLREVVGIDTAWWPRTFTLKELARRAAQVAPAATEETIDAWLARVSAGRRAAALMKPDPQDDIDDPYGLPRRDHDEMVRDMMELIGTLAGRGPWRHARAKR
jgi:protein-tyrosine phosphatase